MTDYDLLQKEYHNCPRCPELVKNRTQVVFGSGHRQAKILFIGEAPGLTEDKEGIPFCGMAGKVLDQLLQAAGLSREDIYITNTILCRPPDNRNPAKEEVENCRSRLDRLIDIIKPQVLVTIGNFATDRILGKSGVTKIHGKPFPLVLGHGSLTVVPVIHPASYLYSGRNPELLEQMKKDFQIIAALVKEQKKQKGLGEF